MLIITGNPVDGFRFIGPFEDHDAALAYAELEGASIEADWWIAPIEAPNYEKPHHPDCPATDGFGCRCDGTNLIEE